MTARAQQERAQKRNAALLSHVTSPARELAAPGEPVFFAQPSDLRVRRPANHGGKAKPARRRNRGGIPDGHFGYVYISTVCGRKQEVDAGKELRAESGERRAESRSGG
jgi:hypothetical protein